MRRDWRNRLACWGLFPLMLFLAACTSVHFLRDIAAFQGKIANLQTRLYQNPRDTHALRDLGIIYFQTQHYTQARDYLVRALVQEPQSAKNLFYYGMTLEFLDNTDDAIKVHKLFERLPRLSPYRKLMAGRYLRLTREKLRAEIKTLVQQETALDLRRISAQTVAVLPLRYLGRDERYAPLGKGLSEMMIVDLGQVNALRLVERLRLQTLLVELAFGRSMYAAKDSAPRLGKLLGAGRIIAGAYDVQDGRELSTDLLNWDILSNQRPSATNKSDALANLFQFEKDLVFAVIADMGIDLTPQEREKIAQNMPTKNLHAFMAYCLGLDQEDAGNLDLAVKAYRQAVTFDPSFSVAADKAEQTENLGLAGGSKEKMLEVLTKIDKPISPYALDAEELVASRQQHNLTGIGANFVPGQDRRKPGEEAFGSAIGIFDLPLPPTLPPGR